MAKRKNLSAALTKAARPRAVPGSIEPVASESSETSAVRAPGLRTLRAEGKADEVLQSMTTRQPPEVVRQLRVLAAELDKPIMYVIGEALNLVFEAHGKPPIAPEHPPE